MGYKDDAYDKRAKKFIAMLRVRTDVIVNNTNYVSLPELYSLKNLFDSFAIIDKFSSSLIINCYHELKISLMKIERFSIKKNGRILTFKEMVEDMYEKMENLYLYEYFGFFSTLLHPEDIHGLPCKVNCGCAPFWVVEPYLTEDGKVAYENVIRFKDPESKKYLCITISKNPRLLEDRKKCSLTDEQLEALKQFVINNRDIIILHSCDYLVLDSIQLVIAIQLRASKGTVDYRIAYTLKNRINSEDNTTSCYYVNLEYMSYNEAVKLYKEIQEEMEANAGKDEEFDIYKPYALASLEILRPE